MFPDPLQRRLLGRIADLLRGTPFEQAVGVVLQDGLNEGRSPHTVAKYLDTLVRLSTFLRDTYHVTTPAAVTSLHCSAFLADVRLHPRAGPGQTPPLQAAPATVASRGQAVRAFFNRLIDMGELHTNPMTGPNPRRPAVRLPRVPDPLITPFSEAEVEALLRVCSVRERAVVLVLLDTGMRVSELCGLGLADYDRLTGAGTVQGAKGGGRRPFALPPRSRAAVTAWLLRRDRYVTPAPAPLFCTTRTLLGAGPLTPPAVRAFLRRRGRQAGVGDVHPHRLRHTCAAMMLENGAGLEQIRQLLGHTSANMTRRYASLRGEALLRHARAFAPSMRLAPDGRRSAPRPAPTEPPVRGLSVPGEECSVEGCTRPIKARGLCDGHYAWRRLHNNAQPNTPIGARKPDPPSRPCAICGGEISGEKLRRHPDLQYCGQGCALAARREKRAESG